ncbi:hypothetical protein JCM11491_005245 [Sporobolomyces phaffii]
MDRFGSVTRSTSKRRLSSFLPRALTPSNSSSPPASAHKRGSSYSTGSMRSSSSLAPFLHLKFTALRPVPQYGHQLPFAHLVDPAVDDLPESLKTDVQREGIKRYLLQNFDEGSFVREVVKERLPGGRDDDEDDIDGGDPAQQQQRKRDSDGMYLVVNRSWARTVGDNKLHLSLYVYQEDKHCATWHAYTDRTISYSRESESAAVAVDATGRDHGDERDSRDSRRGRDGQELDEDEDEDEDEDDEAPPIPNKDPYSTPSALAQYVAANMDSRPSSPFDIPDRDSERPRFDRPRKEPVAAVEPCPATTPPSEQRDPKEEQNEPARTSRSSRNPRSDAAHKGREEVAPTRSDSEPDSQVDEEEKAESVRRSKVEARETDTTKRSKSPIVKSEPIGRRRTDDETDKDSSGVSRSPSPSPRPAKNRSARSSFPCISHATISFPSRGSDSVSFPLAISRGQASLVAPSRSKFRSDAKVAEEEEKEEDTAPVDKRRAENSEEPARRPLSPSRPQGRTKRAGANDPDDAEVQVRKADGRSPSRSRSRSPPRDRRSQSRHARPSRPVSLAPAPSQPQSLPVAVVERAPGAEPTWRSVSRNRHRRAAVAGADDSDDDTLVRGNLDDETLDIPAGGEATLLRHKHERSSTSSSSRLVRPQRRHGGGGEEGSAGSRKRKDEGFDPETVVERASPVVAASHREGERDLAHPPLPPASASLKSAVGGWFKSVGSLIATEAKLVVGKAEEEVAEAELGVEHWEEREREEKRQRKEDRARRREERAKRREEEARAMREKGRELERMVDRAEDAAEGMVEKAERAAIRREKEARKEQASRKERQSKETDHEDPVVGHGDEKARHRRSRSEHGEDPTSTRSRSKPRTPRPQPRDFDQESTRPPPRLDDGHEDSTRNSRRHRSRQTEPLGASDSPHVDEDAKLGSTTTLRQRANSVSASVDAGIRGIRDSVSKIVSDARHVQADEVQVEQDLDRERRKVDKERRRIEKERRVLEDEKRLLEEEKAMERKQRRAAEAADRTRKSSREDDDLKTLPPGLSGNSLPIQQSSPEPIASRRKLPLSRPVRSASSDEDSEAPPPRDRERTTPGSISSSFDHTFGEEDSEASIAPVRSRSHRVRPPPRHSESVTSDTDMSEAPSRSSRSVRSMDRSESEADTPAHLEAKRNARRNSTTIPIETIRALREQQLSSGTRSIPGSPVAAKPRQDFPVPNRGAKTESLEDTRSGPFKSRPASPDSSDEERFDHTSMHARSALAAPDVPNYPRRLSPAPLVASPISPFAAYSPTDPPLRPQPVKPESYRPLPQQPAPTVSSRSRAPPHKSYTPASSGDSSDEADPSRPASVRSRRGYSSTGSGTSDLASRRADASFDSPPSPSYRFPPSDSDGERAPPRRNQSFSRTQPSYPFTTDDEGDSEHDNRQSMSAGRTQSRPDRDDRFDSTFEESEPESLRRIPGRRHEYDDYSDGAGAYDESRSVRVSHGRAAGGGGGSRTMVSKPSSVRSSGVLSASSTKRSQGSSSDWRSHDARSGGQESTRRRDVEGPRIEEYSSYSRATTPYQSLDRVESPPPNSFVPHCDARPQPPPAPYRPAPSSPPTSRIGGFTGFDLRSQSPAGSGAPDRPREKRSGVSKSSVLYGANQAPVGRRMAKRLGAIE